MISRPAYVQECLIGVSWAPKNPLPSLPYEVGHTDDALMAHHTTRLCTMLRGEWAGLMGINTLASTAVIIPQLGTLSAS